MKKLWLAGLVLLCAQSPAVRANPQGCATLQSATPQDLVSYLSAVVPDDKNSDCIIFAMTELGQQKYEAAIPVLVKFLDFQKPRPGGEVVVVTHPLTRGREYPAVGALELIGESTIPALIGAMKAETTSDLGRDNAVAAVMGIYRYTKPKGVRRLKQEFDKTTDSGAKQRLQRAMSTAIDAWCAVSDQDSCKAASTEVQP